MKEQALVQREILIIEADTKKRVEEIEQTMNAEVMKIDAESQLIAEKIIAETRIIEKTQMAEGRAKADLINAESTAWCKKKRAEVDNQVATL